MDNPIPSPPPPPLPPPPSSHKARKVSRPKAATPIPPAPPFRPPPSSSPTNPAPPLPPMPSGGFQSAPKKDNAAKPRFMQYHAAKDSNPPSRPFQPCHMFFYGSLMDSEVLQTILNIPDPPTTQPATISGFQMKMWSIYPTLIPAESRKVAGCVWEVNSEAHFDRLAAYETSAYTWVECEAVLEDGAVLKPCRTFCWAGDAESEELEDGSFDLEWYQKYFKPSVVRRR